MPMVALAYTDTEKKERQDNKECHPPQFSFSQTNGTASSLFARYAMQSARSGELNVREITYSNRYML